MKLKLFITALLFSSVFSAMAQDIPRDTACKYKLKKSIELISTVGSKITDATRINFYDSVGNVFKQYWTNSSYKDTNATFYFYDEKGRVIREYTHHGLRDTIKRDEQKITYTNRGLNDHGLMDSIFGRKINYTYDAKGRAIEITSFNPSERAIYKSTKEYDSLDRCIKQTNFINRLPQSTTITQYDAKGYITKENIALYLPDDTKKPATAYDLFYFYDKKGFLTEKKQAQTYLAPGKKFTHNKVFTYNYTYY